MKLYKYLFNTLFLSLISLAISAQSYKAVTVTAPGELLSSLGEDWNKIDSIVVKGTINKEDFKSLYDCSRLGKLTVINLGQANVEGNRIPDFALYYPDTTLDYLNIKRIILPNNIMEIGRYAFSNMRLKKINFPTSLKKFSMGSFYGCHWMEVDPLIIPEGTTEIPRLCFSCCQSFRKLVLPQSLKTLGTSSFSNTRMEEMNLPNGLDTIEAGAFYGSGELKRVIIPESVTHIGGSAFARIDSLKSINIPHKITEIPYSFLESCCYNLDSIIIPDNITKIGLYAFQSDGALKYIQLSRNLRRIETDAFAATGITEIVLPETLEFLGMKAFGSSCSLEKVYCMAVIPPTTDLDKKNHYEGPFAPHDSNCTLYIPQGTGDLYRNSDGWSSFGNIVETDDFPSQCGITFATNYNVSSSNGMIIIDNMANRTVDIKIYNINGNLVHQEKASETVNIKVPAGIYLVIINNKAYKIMVK